MTKVFFIFSILMPFSFAAQLFWGGNNVVLLPYLLLASCMWLSFQRELNSFYCKFTLLDISTLRVRSLFHSIPLAICFFVFQNTAWNLVVILRDHNLSNFLRILCFYCIVPLIFFLVRRYEEQDMWYICYSISLSGTVIALEFLYETYSTSVLNVPSYFQLKYFYYVKDLTGRELTQLIGSAYRPPGLLEHVHATVAYAGIATVISIGNYLRTKQMFFIIAAAIAADAVIYSGVRLATYATFIALVVLGVSVKKIGKKEYTKRVLQCMVAAVLGAMLIHVILSTPAPVEMHAQFLSGEVAPNMSGTDFYRNFVLSSVLQSIQAFHENPWALFTGFGPALLSNWGGVATDDFFPIQIFDHLGLVGSILFFGSWILGIIRSYTKSISGEYAQSKSLLLSLTCCVLFILLFSTMHSAVLVKKGVFWILFVFLAIASKYAKND